LSNTQIYKNAIYISIKLQFKAPKLLTYYQKKVNKKKKKQYQFKQISIPKYIINKNPKQLLQYCFGLNYIQVKLKIKKLMFKLLFQILPFQYQL
jgi:hypothetical protein